MSETKKIGDIGICPNCGAPYQPGMGKCPECGHVFQNVKANGSAQLLAEKLEKIIIKHQDDEHTDKRDDEITNCIMRFVIPSDKEDLIEFIASLDAGRRSSVDWAKAYNAKYKECILKAQVMFPNDEHITQLVKLTNKIGFIERIKMIVNYNKVICILLAMILIPVIILISISISESNTRNEIENKISTQLENLSNEISNLPNPTKDNRSDCASSIEHIIWMPVNTEFSDGRGGDDVEALNTLQERAIRSFILKKNSYIKRVNASGLVPPLQEDTISNYGY